MTPRRQGKAGPAPSCRWLHHVFYRETGRIRCHERYRREQPLQPGDNPEFQQLRLFFGGRRASSVPTPVSVHASGIPLLLVPSGLFLRKYLRLIEALLDGNNVRSNTSSHSAATIHPFAVVLLESAVELADHCNNAAPNERSRIMRLFERHCVGGNQTAGQDGKNGGVAMPFADLSYQHNFNEGEDEDEGMDSVDALALTLSAVEDRSRRALARAGWMLQGLGHILILTNNDTESQEVARLYKVHSSSTISRIKSLPSSLSCCSTLIDHLIVLGIVDRTEQQTFLELAKRCEEEFERQNSEKQQIEASCLLSSATAGGRVPYMSESEVSSGLVNGKYFRGKLEVTKINIREAYVSVCLPTSKKMRYYIDDAVGNFNRAFHNDTVIIEPLPEDQWGRPLGKRRLVHRTSVEEEDISDRDEQSDWMCVPSARVVKVARHGRRRYIATVPDSVISNRMGGNDTSSLVIPMDIRIPKIRLKTRLGFDRFAKKRILVEVDSWDLASNFPSGHFVETVGSVGDIDTEIACLLIEHEINLPPFSASALACLPNVDHCEPWSIPEEELAHRRDLRQSHRIFSVDPVGCVDIDDTMSARVLMNGDVEFGVHIADVCHFVPHNSALDREARCRGTTFYLVDRRFDMLPTILSSNLCSLHDNVDRLAVSVIITMSPDFDEVKSRWFGRTIIHNCAAMTYDQADNILHDRAPEDADQAPPFPLTAGAPVRTDLIPELKSDLSLLTRLARKLRRDREVDGGAIDLSSGDRGSELKFVLDKNGHPTQIMPKAEKEIHSTIAEMMILANRHVACRTYEAFPDLALLRIHQSVEENRFDELQNTLKAAGIKFDGSSNMALAKTLKAAKLDGRYFGVIDSLIQSITTRAMSEAQYICSGKNETGEAGFGHYGLGVTTYTHFTSPIRRYADVVVHRLLLAAVSNSFTSFSSRKYPSFQFKMENNDSNFSLLLPESETMSVLGASQSDGKKTKWLETDLPSDLVTESLSELALEGRSTKSTHAPNKIGNDGDRLNLDLYCTSHVVKICDRLNHMNRSAKRSSMDCQRLFLSLYFEQSIERAPAVIVSTRVNGLVVYVARYDLSAPVFLCDKDGNVQMDPSIAGLPRNSGLPPTGTFCQLKQCRLFPQGKCSLLGDRLEVSVQTRKVSFEPLDVITVQLSCNISESVGRIPPPQLNLLALGQKLDTQSSRSLVRPSSASIKQSKAISNLAEKTLVSSDEDYALDISLYKIVSSIEVVPKLAVPPRMGSNKDSSKITEREKPFPGRFIFSGFSNPDTRSAEQEAAQDAAAEASAQRRSMYTKALQVGFDESRQIERETTARMQRLAAEKRSVRRRKAN